VSGGEAIEEAREMVARHSTCEPCVVSALLSVIAAEREKVRVLRGKLAKVTCAMPIWDGNSVEGGT